MKKIYAVCGLVGSGKTTFSKQLAQSTGAFRFSLDEWMIPLFGEHMPRAEFDKQRNQLTELFQQAAQQLLELGVAVIFDFGYWKKRQRLEVRAWADSIDAELELIYLQCASATCYQRVLNRNQDSQNINYQITEDMFLLFQSWFEAPEKDEQVTIINTEID